MPQSFIRDRFTWLAYLLLAFFAYFVNVLGPTMPFLKAELGLSYTASSLHFSALAVGILVVGLAGDRLIARFPRMSMLWAGAASMSAGALLLITARIPALTITAAFLMGCAGALILAIAPAALSDYHRPFGAAVISEANTFASLVGAAAPLLVGWAASVLGSWRLALAALAATPLILRLAFGRVSLKRTLPGENQQEPSPSASRLPLPGLPLPGLYWLLWSAIVLSESAEYCMIFWSPDYLENTLGLLKANAALAASLFLIAMILGRAAGSLLVRRFSASGLVSASILVALVGFGLFWLSHAVPVVLAGLFITGLGVASLYPLTLSMAIGAAGGNTIQAGARATLSTGASILVLPLLLGRLADSTGIHAAYFMVVFMLTGAFALIQISRKIPTAAHHAHE